jgi:hypothetical protein
LRIARHFNAGFLCKSRQVPEGRPTGGYWFSRSFGTHPTANLFPALKRRAIFRKSLRDYALFAFASILLAAISATAQTTNALSDAEIQGRQLVQKLLDERPAENSTNSGVLTIRNRDGSLTTVSMTCKIVVSPTSWTSFYTSSAMSPWEERLFVTHANNWTNVYLHYLAGAVSKVTLPMADTSPFANSDFWLGDLGLEFFHWPGQKILKKEFRRQCACMVLESTNPNPSTNGYSRVVSWIDEESGGIVQAEAYDFNSKLLKEFAPKSFKKVNGQWELQEMEIRNVQTGSRTRIEFDLKKQ